MCKHFSANSAVSETVEAREVIVHVVRDVNVTVIGGVGLDDERAIGETWGDGRIDEAMPDDVEVSVDKCAIERIVGDEDHRVVDDDVNVFSKIFDMSK